ncbi:MAG TPA: hypothetical protein DDW52_03095 [Planctomycetaceae bacterium]|nr:hypothetical protein [Planctomycetaceae bacterium]
MRELDLPRSQLIPIREALRTAFLHFRKELFPRSPELDTLRVRPCEPNGVSNGQCGQQSIDLCMKRILSDEKAVMATLVHEMVHAWRGRTLAFHDDIWADEMERVGLMPTDTGNAGGSRTGLHVSHFVIDGGPFERAFQDFDGRIDWASLLEGWCPSL